MTFAPSLTHRGTEAWAAASSRLSDGAWHSRIELEEAMLDVGEISIRQVGDILTSAARAGLVDRDPKPGPKRRKIKALRFQATDLLRLIQDADSSARSVVKA